MSLQPPTKIMSKNAISAEVITEVLEDMSRDVSEQEVVKRLNHLQGLIDTEQNMKEFVEGVESPERVVCVEDDRVYAIVSPVTWWEFQQHSTWSNEVDAILLEVHSREFFKQISSWPDYYTAQQRSVLHPIVVEA